MLARIVLGAIAGYGLYLIAAAIAASSDGFGMPSFGRAMTFRDYEDFELVLMPARMIPAILGAVAGYCWHLLASERND